MSPRRPRRGASAIEFALVIPVLMTIFGAILELSLYLGMMHRVSRIARDSARVGSVILEGPSPTGDDIVAAAETHAWLALDAAGVDCRGDCTVAATWELDDDSGYMLVDVVVDAPHRGLTGLMPALVDSGVAAHFAMLTQQQ